MVFGAALVVAVEVHDITGLGGPHPVTEPLTRVAAREFARDFAEHPRAV